MEPQQYIFSQCNNLAVYCSVEPVLNRNQLVCLEIGLSTVS